MTISLPRAFSVGVSARVRPTVAVALTVSYRISIADASLTKASPSVANAMMLKEVMHTATALPIASSLTVLPNRETRSLPRTALAALAISTAKVTVLIPPAVPTGEPPTNISKRASSAEGVVSASWGIVKKPAVLVVTDWNSAICSLSRTECAPSVAGLLHSKARNAAPPANNSAAVLTRTILDCSVRYESGRLRFPIREKTCVLFIMLSFFFMFKYCKYDKTRYLALSGLFFGLSISCKWIGLLAGLGLAIIYFVNKFATKKKLMPVVGKGLLFFIVIPALIYIPSFLLFPNLQSIKTNSFETLVEQQKMMYEYHSGLKAEHPFTSKWYTWPVGYKPIWYYTKDVTKTTSQTISSIPNIIIWWPAILAVLILPYYIIKKRNGKSLFLLVAILSLYIPSSNN